jgi:OOP family OmpA-OmpF porin
MFFSLEGRLVEIETQATRKEAQALAGFGLRWGSHQSTVAAFTPPPVEAPAPAPVEAPAPAPVLVVVPVATATQQYCTILDLQFDINKDAIQREDIEKLAVVGTFMTKYPNTTAVIEGHADNVGAADHNMKLSQARAQSVVTYLTDTIHIDPSRLSAVGFGDTRPIADNSTEDGKRQNRRIDAVIACVTDVAGLPVAPARVTMALFIDFDQNKAEVKPEYDGPLGKVADFLKANPTVTASVEGHTGNLQTTPALAMEISRRRAQNVVNYLVDHFGIDRSRLKAQGFGDNRRFAYNTSAEGEQENRRVNLIFNYAK